MTYNYIPNPNITTTLWSSDSGFSTMPTTLQKLLPHYCREINNVYGRSQVEYPWMDSKELLCIPPGYDPSGGVGFIIGFFVFLIGITVIALLGWHLYRNHSALRLWKQEEEEELLKVFSKIFNPPCGHYEISILDLKFYLERTAAEKEDEMALKRLEQRGKIPKKEV